MNSTNAGSDCLMLFAVLELPGLVRKLHLPWSNWIPNLVSICKRTSRLRHIFKRQIISLLQVSNVYTPKIYALVGIIRHLSTATYYEPALYQISIGNQYGNSQKLLQFMPTMKCQSESDLKQLESMLSHKPARKTGFLLSRAWEESSNSTISDFSGRSACIYP